jgi:hypothetical protein
MTVYRNGLNMNSYMTNLTDIGGSQANTSRSITAGNHHDPFLSNRFNGYIHSHAHWSVPLGQAEISTLYNAGAGTDVDLNSGRGSYVSNSDLQTWYKYGDLPSSTIHENFAPTNIQLINSTQSEADVRRSAPEGSFYRADGTGEVGETSQFQDVANAQTISSWCRTNTLPAEGITNDVFRIRNGVGNLDHIALSLITTGGVSYWQYQFSNGAGTFNTLVGTTPVVVGQWYHLVGCKQDTFSARFFVNGLDDLPPVIGGIVTTTNVSRSTHIGFNGVDATENFDGDIYDAALWGGLVSENGIRAIYSGGWKNLDLRVAHPCYDEASLLSQWWVFGDPSASGTHPAGDTQFPNRASGGYTLFTGMTGVGAEMRNRGIIDNAPMGNCASFDDISGLATVTALPLGIANSWTISAWIKPENLTSGIQYPLFFGEAQVNANINEIIWKIDADDPLKPLILEVIGTVADVPLQRTRYNELLVEGEWQHITMVWNGTIISMYYDGVLITPVVDTSNVGSMNDSSRFVELGGSDEVLPASFGLAFEGKISHVGMWNTDLSVNQIQTIASQGHGIDLRYNKDQYIQAESLQHYWKLGEDSFLAGRDFMDTTRGNSLLPMTVETAPPPPLPSLLQTNSLVMDSDLLLSNTNTLGFSDTWSLAIWAKLGAIDGAQQELIFIQPVADSKNAIKVTSAGISTVDDLRIIIDDNSGASKQTKEWDGVMQGNTDTWVHYVITFGGETGNGANGLKLHTQGIDRGAPDTTTTDTAGTYVDGVRRFALGALGHWSGPIYSYALYDTVLSAAAIAQMYNGGNGRDFDLDNDWGNYTNSANLVHYYRLGIGTDETDFGLDRTDTVLELDMDTIGGWSVGDLTTDVPDGE